MNDFKAVPENVNQKVYRLNSARYSSLSHLPVLVERPFSPPGQNYAWEFESIPQPGISSVIRKPEGGFSSKKLYQCGDVWYLKEYFDIHGAPFRFEYGPRIQAPKNISTVALRAWAHEDYADGDPVMQEYAGVNSVKSPDEIRDEKTPMTEEQKTEKRKINRAHAKQEIRMLCNLNKLHYMYTLTFAPVLHENVKDLRFILPLEKQKDRHEIEVAWNKRRSVLSRYCKKQGYEFKYVKVLEQHTGKKAEDDSCKIGTYHIHLATDKPIDKHVLQKLWGFGVVWVDDFNKKRKKGERSQDDPGRDRAVCDPGVYMSKYMEKDFDDADLHGFRAYSPSTNLQRPRPLRDEEIIREEIECAGAELHTVFDAEYQAEYTIYRHGEQPRPVKLTIRSRIFNFRVQGQASAGSLHAGAAGRPSSSFSSSAVASSSSSSPGA